AQELATRHVAIAVAVHLAEPHGAAIRGRHGPPRGAVDRAHGHEAAETVAPSARRAATRADHVATRDLAGFQHPVAVLIELVDQLDRLAHLANAQPAIAVLVDQIEQALALIGDRHRHTGGPGSVLQRLLLLEVGEHLLEVELAIAIS